MITSLSTTILAMIFPALIMVMMLILSSKKNIDREKATPFECGFDPKSFARTPFSLRFFLLAVIFLVFDIEIILLMPLPMSNAMNMNLSLLNILIFLSILIVGLLHEWREGSLNWQM